MAAATQNPLEAFIWGAGGSKKTPEEIARDKEIAADLLLKAGNTSPVEHWTQGAARVADALSGVIKQKRAERAGVENETYNQGILSELFKGGSSAQPAANPLAAASIPSSGASAEMAASAPSQPLDMTGNEVYSGFMDTVKTAVQNPYALAAIAATGKAESGFSPKNATRTWSDPSQSGQPGTAGGIMSWRGPRYNALAATGDLSPAGQAKFFLQEDPQLIAALNKAGSVEEAQRLMNNAWAFAGYDQPGGEAARRLQTANGFLPTFQGAAQPTQVASLDPSVGMTSPAVTAIEEQAPGGMGAPLTDQSFDNRFGQTPLPADVLQGKDSLVSALTETNVSGIPQPANIPLPVAADRSQMPAQQPTAVQQVAQALPAAGQTPQAVPGMSEALLRAISDPRATPQTRAVVQALMQQEQAKQAQAAEQQQWMARQQYEREQQQNDPLRRQQLEMGQLELEKARNPQPGFRTLTPDEKKQLGLPANGAFQAGSDGKISQIGGGGVTVNNEGSIPAGYQAIRDAEGRVTSIEPIAGSPAALAADQAKKTTENQGGRKDVATDVITNAASNARQILKDGWMTTGTPGRLAANLSESPAAELRRQIGVLKSQATIETLSAMRQASPTGGAMGAVSDKEGDMLAAAAGAIDPNANKADVEKALDNYEHTLLRVIHGPKVGDAIFEQTRVQKPISEMTDEELEALANGD